MGTAKPRTRSRRTRMAARRSASRSSPRRSKGAPTSSMPSSKPPRLQQHRQDFVCRPSQSAREEHQRPEYGDRDKRQGLPQRPAGPVPGSLSQAVTDSSSTDSDSLCIG